MLKWPRRLHLVTKMCKSPILLKKDFEEIAFSNKKKLLKKQKMRLYNAKERPVKFGIIDMRWFYRNRRTFAAFSLRLNQVPNSYYASDFMACLLN